MEFLKHVECRSDPICVCTDYEVLVSIPQLHCVMKQFVHQGDEEAEPAKKRKLRISPKSHLMVGEKEGRPGQEPKNKHTST